MSRSRTPATPSRAGARRKKKVRTRVVLSLTAAAAAVAVGVAVADSDGGGRADRHADAAGKTNPGSAGSADGGATATPSAPLPDGSASP
ncbi:CAP domain-containing protein, partial [Streptomyces sp. NPDC059447]